MQFKTQKTSQNLWCSLPEVGFGGLCLTRSWVWDRCTSDLLFNEISCLHKHGRRMDRIHSGQYHLVSSGKHLQDCPVLFFSRKQTGNPGNRMLTQSPHCNLGTPTFTWIFVFSAHCNLSFLILWSHFHVYDKNHNFRHSPSFYLHLRS